MRRCVALQDSAPREHWEKAESLDGVRCNQSASHLEVWGKTGELQVVVYLCPQHHAISVTERSKEMKET